MQSCSPKRSWQIDRRWPLRYAVPNMNVDDCRKSLTALIWLSALPFSGPLSRQGLLRSALRARLQVIRVALHFSDDVFRLNLALEATKSVFY